MLPEAVRKRIEIQLKTATHLQKTPAFTVPRTPTYCPGEQTFGLSRNEMNEYLGLMVKYCTGGQKYIKSVQQN